MVEPDDAITAIGEKRHPLRESGFAHEQPGLKRFSSPRAPPCRRGCAGPPRHPSREGKQPKALAPISTTTRSAFFIPRETSRRTWFVLSERRGGRPRANRWRVTKAVSATALPPSGIKSADHALPASPDGRSKPDANTQGSVVRRRRRPALVRRSPPIPSMALASPGVPATPFQRGGTSPGQAADLGFQSGTPIRFATSR